MIELWELRNEEVCSKKKSRKTTKKKNKGSNRCFSITQPTNLVTTKQCIFILSRCGQGNSEATVTQLEKYIAIKSKAITNITKWTERSSYKVKSIPKYIRMGGEE